MTDPASPEIAMAALAKLHHVMGHDRPTADFCKFKPKN